MSIICYVSPPLDKLFKKRNLDKGEFEISTRDKAIKVSVPFDEVEVKVDSLI